jgi:flagellar biosynthesis protein FlhB
MSGRSKSGSEIKDKTQHCESRPGAKEKIRNAKRSFKKRARQQLKRETQNAASDVIHPTFRCIAMGDHNLGQDNRILPDYHST